MLADDRMKICKSCPLVKIDSSWGPICDSSKWMNPKTGDVSKLPHVGWIKGCGCRLKFKTTNLTSHCIAGKW